MIMKIRLSHNKHEEDGDTDGANEKEKWGPHHNKEKFEPDNKTKEIRPRRRNDCCSSF